MKLKDSFKKFSDGAIQKVIPPASTCAIALKKIRAVIPPIYVRHFPVMRPSRIPQYFVQGTGTFTKISNQQGANGKGHTEAQALASGLMEFSERYSCKKFFLYRKAVAATFSDMRGNPYSLRDLYAHCPEKGTPAIISDREAGNIRVRWFKASTLSGEPVYLPVPLAGYLVLGTNGMAAGNSLEEAVLHGICEVTERHVKALIEGRKIPVPAIDAATISNPAARDLIRRFRDLGHEVRIKDFSLGFGLPAIGVVRQIHKGDYVVTAGVAASRDEALVRALTENSQGEGSREENRRPGRAIRHLCVSTKIIPWSAVPEVSDGNIKVEVNRIQRLLRQQGMRIYYLETTDKALDVPCVFVLIAGAQVLDRRFSHRSIMSGLIYESLWLDDTATADRLLDIAESNDPANRPLYWVNRGISLRRRRRFAEAAGYFERYLNRRKKSGAVFDDKDLRLTCLVNLGIVNLALRNQAKAAQYFSTLVGLQRDFSLGQIRLMYESIPSLTKDMPLLDQAEKLILRIREKKG